MVNENPDEIFAHKHIKDKVKEKKKEIPEETVEEEEWYVENPDRKPDRVAFVRMPKDYEFKTKAS